MSKRIHVRPGKGQSSLYDQSLITYEEYEQKKKEILEEL